LEWWIIADEDPRKPVKNLGSSPYATLKEELASFPHDRILVAIDGPADLESTVLPAAKTSVRITHQDR